MVLNSSGSFQVTINVKSIKFVKERAMVDCVTSKDPSLSSSQYRRRRLT